MWISPLRRWAVAELRRGRPEAGREHVMQAGGYDRTRDGLADGCCSALAPCSHQQRSPRTICPSCTQAKRLGSLEAENARLRKGIQDMLDGNYPHPRTYRPGKCPHDVWYFDECPSCDEAHLKSILAPQDSTS